MPAYDAMSDAHLRAHRRKPSVKRQFQALGAAGQQPQTALSRLVEAKLKPRDDLTLPFVAQRPHEVLCLQLVQRRRKLPKERPDPPCAASRTVYLGKGDAFTRYDELFQSSEMPLALSRRTSPPAGHAAEVTATTATTASNEFAATNSSLNATSPRRENPPETVVANELTLTYLSIVQKSEDYGRRQLARGESRELAVVRRRFVEELRRLQQREDEQNAVVADEILRRRDAEDEETDAWRRLLAAAARGKKFAKMHEEVLPGCALLDVGERGSIPCSANSAFVLELRWQSDVALNCWVLGFDASNRFVSATGMGDVLRCPISGLPVVRPFSMIPGGVKSACSRCAIEFVPRNLAPQSTYARFVVAVFNASRPGALLGGLRRCYFTAKVPNGGTSLDRVLSATAPLNELWSVHVVPRDSMCCVVGSLVADGSSLSLSSTAHAEPSHNSSVERRMWALQSHVLWCDVPTHQRLPQHLAESLLMNPSELWARCLSGVQMMHRYNAYFWEDLHRRRLAVEEHDARRELSERLDEEAPSFDRNGASGLWRSNSLRRLGSLSYNGLPKPPSTPNTKSGNGGGSMTPRRAGVGGGGGGGGASVRFSRFRKATN